MEIINIIVYAILAPCITLFLYNVIGSPKVFDDIRDSNGLKFVELNENMILHFVGRLVAKHNVKLFLCTYCLNFWVALFVGIFAAYSNHISYISVVAIIALGQQLIKYAK